MSRARHRQKTVWTCSQFNLRMAHRPWCNKHCAQFQPAEACFRQCWALSGLPSKPPNTPFGPL
eukprot:15450381-Alexandrium_andersonii.AAC.1